jgi:predicted acyltransferase
MIESNGAIRSSQPRAAALDALRGLAILLMVLANTLLDNKLPTDQALPAWMYHAQKPPPTHDFNPNLPGLTWPDLVFPLFLFTMGAVIPLTLKRRLDAGETRGRIILGVLQRGLLLVWFAIFLEHVRPENVPQFDRNAWFIAWLFRLPAWAIGLLGFGLMFAMFTRLPAAWPQPRQVGIRVVGWLGALALLALLHYPPGDQGTHFSLQRNDIIIIVLANMAVLGAVIWLFTQENTLVRLGLLGLYLAIRLASANPGWVQTVYNYTPYPWLVKWYFWKYLFNVIPGTVIGDAMLVWMRSAAAEREKTQGRPEARWAVLAALGVALTVILLIGLQARILAPTTGIALAACAVAAWLARSPQNATERLIRTTVLWGVYWLILGLILEPFEGGIKKDRSTLSYHFLTEGIALFLLSSLIVMISLYGKERWFSLLASAGQNPLIGYCGMDNFILPLLALTGLMHPLALMTAAPWLVALRVAVETILLAYFLHGLTRRRIFWRT